MLTGNPISLRMILYSDVGKTNDGKALTFTQYMPGAHAAICALTCKLIVASTMNTAAAGVARPARRPVILLRFLAEVE